MSTQSPPHPERPASGTSAAFKPPTPEQFGHWLQQHVSGPMPVWMVWLPLLAVALMVLLASFTPGPIGYALPWVLLLGVLGFLYYRQYTVRDAGKRVQQIQDMLLLRRYVQVARTGWRLLPKLMYYPHWHHQTVSAMTHALDQLGHYETARVGYDWLLQHTPKEHPMTMALQASRTLAVLLSDRLAEADDGLRTLKRQITSQQADPTEQAVVQFLELAQAVCTYRFSDGLALENQLIDTLRPLGMSAGYGYGMMAWCYDQQKQRLIKRQQAESQDTTDEQPSQAIEQEIVQCEQFASQWWQRAILLLPQDTLVFRFPMLQTVAQAMAAKEVRP